MGEWEQDFLFGHLAETCSCFTYSRVGGKFRHFKMLEAWEQIYHSGSHSEALNFL